MYEITDTERNAIQRAQAEFAEAAASLYSLADTHGADGADVTSIVAMARKFERTAASLSDHTS